VPARERVKYVLFGRRVISARPVRRRLPRGDLVSPGLSDRLTSNLSSGRSTTVRKPSSSISPTIRQNSIRAKIERQKRTLSPTRALLYPIDRRKPPTIAFAGGSTTYAPNSFRIFARPAFGRRNPTTAVDAKVYKSSTGRRLSFTRSRGGPTYTALSLIAPRVPAMFDIHKNRCSTSRGPVRDR